MIPGIHAVSNYTEQAHVTNWPARVALVVIVLLLIALALWGMRRGWRNRQRRQADIPEPLFAPREGIAADVTGLFLGTSTSGDWLDRIAVFDLGVRSRARVGWSAEGVWFDRDGANGLLIPADAVAGVRLDRGVAGTVRAKDSVIVVTWRLGERLVDSGFRCDDTEGHETVWNALTQAYGRMGVA